MKDYSDFMKFKVYRAATFEKEFSKLPKPDKESIQKFERKLVENPYLGKPLSYVFLREMKLGSRRVYYLIYEDFIIVLMVAISDKKTQQATINAIKLKLEQRSEITLGLYDLLGRGLVVYTDENVVGNYQKDLDLVELKVPVGLYLLKFNVNGKTYTKAIPVLRN
ncbi:MAG: T9SS type A sorting domain-containing protein [Bacteroidetes bacterium]|nr:T9SS type A sorting domain-containing protein [Bacteroidota bacterium]